MPGAQRGRRRPDRGPASSHRLEFEAMVTYRAAPITQRDGSPLASSNCRMAAVASGIDHHSLGAITSTGAEMRSRQSDQVGGTDSGDAAEAWRTYGQELVIRDGRTFADALVDLDAGRQLQLDVWHAAAGGPCLSGSGAYGHSMAVAPERSGTRWLVSDPWCSPASWTWWEEGLLRAGAETLGAMTYSAATGGRYWPRGDAELLVRMRHALRALFTLYTPATPAATDPPATGGGGRIFYTATRPQDASSEETDVALNAGDGLVSNIRANVPAGLPFYSDANLGHRLGQMSIAGSVVFIGNPIGETVAGGSRAILVKTGNAYNDGTTRPTIVYVAADAIDTYTAPPTSSTGDVDEAIAERDAEWRDWLMSGAPGTEP